MKSTQRFSAWLRPRYSLRLLFVAMTLAGVVLAYVGSYVARSARGRYEPAVIGLGGVKWYDWAPAGFVEEYDWQWKDSLPWCYYPLWRLDRRFWHPSIQDAVSTAYPVDEVPDEEIGKVYRAWDAR